MYSLKPNIRFVNLVSKSSTSMKQFINNLSWYVVLYCFKLRIGLLYFDLHSKHLFSVFAENSLKTDPDVYQDIHSKFEIFILNLN